MILGLTPTCLALASPDDPRPEPARIKAHVETLASPAFGGRKGKVAEKSRRYLIEEFTRLGLAPLFGESFHQDIPGKEPGRPLGRNVGAKIIGADPKLKDEWVIVAAHFDHLGVREGVLYPGADDNASAVAMMLEVARCLAAGRDRPARSLMLVGFDLEEVGLFGSRYFAEHPPVPIDRVALFVTADMLGRALGGVCREHLFVMGTEHLPESRAWIARASEGLPLKVGQLGADLLLLDRSDYGPFRLRKVPFLFFSTGENPLYHTPRDVAETLDYPKVEAATRLILDVVRQVTGPIARPSWRASPDHGIDEARTLREVYAILKMHRESLKIGGPATFLMNQSIESLDGILARGSITAGERARLIRMAQVVMASIF